MNRYGIATLFESQPDGYEFTEANTPLHLTHIDVITINLESEAFISKLQLYLQDQASFDVIPIANTFFGPDKDIPVTLLERNPELMSFHTGLVQFLETHGAEFDNPQFLKEDYAPHISIYGKRRVLLHRPLTVSSVSIGHKRTDVPNPPNRIIATVRFGLNNNLL